MNMLKSRENVWKTRRNVEKPLKNVEKHGENVEEPVGNTRQVEILMVIQKVNYKWKFIIQCPNCGSLFQTDLDNLLILIERWKRVSEKPFYISDSIPKFQRDAGEWKL